MKLDKWDKIWLLVAALLVILIIAGSGCHQESPVVATTVIQTPVQALTKIVYQTNWLVTLGILLFAAGCYAFFTGNSKGTGLMAAGIAVCGGVLAYAAATQFTEELMKWAPWVVAFSVAGIAIAVVIYAYGHISDTAKAKVHDAVKTAVTTGVADISDVKQILKV